ncbi:OmpA family protein [Puniceibacterium confluentis]|uniref:OmpA family protein n=1 Tax=Puniceibacterium confluentis TaxID=1958944 RepID=UPI001FEA028E|nr:OmpA family protein [Puniceibacterium confluentis]
MANRISKAVRSAMTVAALVSVVGVSAVVPGYAQSTGVSGGAVDARTPVVSTQNTRTIRGEQYIPGIWVDPDGCEHWVMDDGVEGYMDNHLTRQGIPVCRRQNVCGVMNTDQFFATDKYAIAPAGRQRLADFFRSSSAVAFVVVGHTDSRASDDYNMRLSYNRANSVAAVGKSVGANIVDVRGYGERMPVATNGTNEGMAKNRRVEIICIQ